MGVLADKIRAKYPGAYQGIADDQLEAAVIAKYPQYARVSAPAEPSMLQSAMAGPGQAVDRLLGAVVPGEAGKRLAGNEATAGQELKKATVRGFDEPLGLSDFTPIGISSMAGGPKGIEHGRAIQGAVSEFAGDALRDPYTWGALGALKRLGLVGKGLTAGANAIFALKAGEAVPGEFAEAKRLYDEKGFTPEVTEAIAKGVLLGGAAAMGARGTLKEGAQFGREATAAGGRAVRGVAEKANRIPGEAMEGLGAAAGTGLGATVGGVPGAVIGNLLGERGGTAIKALLQRLAAEKAGVPTEVVDVQAPKPDLAPGETLRPVQTPQRRPYVPEFPPEAMGLEPVLSPEAQVQQSILAALEARQARQAGSPQPATAPAPEAAPAPSTGTVGGGSFAGGTGGSRSTPADIRTDNPAAAVDLMRLLMGESPESIQAKPSSTLAQPEPTQVGLFPDGERAMPGGRSGTAQSPEIPFKTDNPEAALALQRLLAGEPVEAAPAKAHTKTARQTWPQFNKERMGKYMKEFGSHAAAIRKIAEEWAAYKAQV